MNGDFIEALNQIAREREISTDALIETLELALATAYKKNYGTETGDVRVVCNRETGVPRVYLRRTVVDGPEVGPNDISALDARRQLKRKVAVGEVVETDVTPNEFGRIAVQTARQVVVQKLREAEREKVLAEYTERIGEVVTGVIQRREHRNVLINIGKLEAVLPLQEQVPTEPYRFNDRIKVYILDARAGNKGPIITVSRTHPSIIRRLFEFEVPEIADGIVSIKAVAREPGARSKIGVSSRDEKIDPVGSCVGHRGSRVQAVVNELYDEKIDIIRWSADPAVFIAESLAPAKTTSVTIDEAARSSYVIVPDAMLSLAIGKAGQNVRLAARLTGWRIDIRSESQSTRTAAEVAEDPEGTDHQAAEPGPAQSEE